MQAYSYHIIIIQIIMLSTHFCVNKNNNSNNNKSSNDNNNNNNNVRGNTDQCSTAQRAKWRKELKLQKKKSTLLSAEIDALYRARARASGAKLLGFFLQKD